MSNPKQRPPGFVAWHPGRRASPGWVANERGCHIWLGSRGENGYAHVWHEGTHQLVYRVRYEREVGPIPDGMTLDHFVCNNGAGGCCNPLHCRPATQRENLLRSEGVSAQNAAKTHCPAGHEYSESNTYRDAKGLRHCRACGRVRRRARVDALHAANGIEVERRPYRVKNAP